MEIHITIENFKVSRQTFQGLEVISRQIQAAAIRWNATGWYAGKPQTTQVQPGIRTATGDPAFYAAHRLGFIGRLSHLLIAVGWALYMQRINSMSQHSQTPHNAHNTHELFFREITRGKLNELLNRADKSTKLLETHLNKRLPQHIRAITQSSLSKHTQLCSIYINFVNTNTSHHFGHCSLHLHQKYLQNASKRHSRAGRFHMKNNKEISLIQCV